MEGRQVEFKKLASSIFKRSNKTIHPANAILLAVLVALIISAINLFLFVRSDMYEKVLLIQNPEQIIVNDETIDVSSPLSKDELGLISSDIDNLFSTLKDESDYPAEDLSETSLGF